MLTCVFYIDAITAHALTRARTAYCSDRNRGVANPVRAPRATTKRANCHRLFVASSTGGFGTIGSYVSGPAADACCLAPARRHVQNAKVQRVRQSECTRSLHTWICRGGSDGMQQTLVRVKNQGLVCKQTNNPSEIPSRKIRHNMPRFDFNADILVVSLPYCINI